MNPEDAAKLADELGLLQSGASDEAIHEIHAARASIPKLRERAERCARLGLTVLAREYSYYANELEVKIPMQVKAMKGDVAEGFR